MHSKQDEPVVYGKASKLLLYNAFPRCYKSMGDAIKDIPRIAELGFNAVWLNPMNKTGNITVKRPNILTSEYIDVTGSLYATYDFSRLNNELFPDFEEETIIESTGDPSSCTKKEKSLVRAYTDTARIHGLKPIFDIVLNHVSLDSPLVSGSFQHFIDKKIDTSRWFNRDAQHHWDDIIPFNYEDPEIRAEIIEHLWIPHIRKYILEFGFMGVRVDFGTGLSPELQGIVLPEINKLVEKEFGVNAIIFAESLPPRNLEKICVDYRELYTHVTNGSLFNPIAAARDIGLKQQLTHLTKDGKLRDTPGGSIGFPASHDDGPNVRNLFHDEAIKNIHADDYKRYIYYESENRKRKLEVERATTELVDACLSATDPEKITRFIMEQRRRIATCALISDGGMYLLSGDEFGDPTPKSVFQKADRSSIYNESDSFEHFKSTSISNHSALIRNINAAMNDMPTSVFPHWSKIIPLDPPNQDLLVIMRYNGHAFSDVKPELMIVHLNDEPLTITDEIIQCIAEKNVDVEHGNNQAYSAVERAHICVLGNCVLDGSFSDSATLYNFNETQAFSTEHAKDSTKDDDAAAHSHFKT